jgi:FkbM family methyltransferase
VTFNEQAVSSSAGSVTFNVDNKTHGGGSNSLLAHSEHFATRARVDRYSPTTVTAITLDEYADSHGISHIDLLKLDIEGAELLALEGARRLLADHAIDFIASEVRFIPDYVGQPLLGELMDFLATAGYTLFNVYAPSESEVRQALFGDAVFISDAMRRRLQATHGESSCGWSQPAP